MGKACRVGRTIADLAGEAEVELPHIAEALQFRVSLFGMKEKEQS
jgi:predicted ATPase with chaperone activity